MRRTGFTPKASWKRLRLRSTKPLTRKASLDRKSSLKAKGRKQSLNKSHSGTADLKRKVWKEFSIFIRTRGADSEGFNRCVTCGERFYWKALHAGHFLRGRLNANLFNETSCWPQCSICNVEKHGHPEAYERFMLEAYGQMWIDHLKRQREVTHKWEADELQALLDSYKKLTANTDS
jgi:hypothetical protein